MMAREMSDVPRCVLVPVSGDKILGRIGVGRVVFDERRRESVDLSSLGDLIAVTGSSDTHQEQARSGPCGEP